MHARGENKGLIRLREVQALTGWDYKYVRKLVACGALRCWQPNGCRGYYYREQVKRIVEGKLE